MNALKELAKRLGIDVGDEEAPPPPGFNPGDDFSGPSKADRKFDPGDDVTGPSKADRKPSHKPRPHADQALALLSGKPFDPPATGDSFATDMSGNRVPSSIVHDPKFAPDLKFKEPTFKDVPQESDPEYLAAKAGTFAPGPDGFTKPDKVLDDDGTGFTRPSVDVGTGGRISRAAELAKGLIAKAKARSTQAQPFEFPAQMAKDAYNPDYGKKQPFDFPVQMAKDAYGVDQPPAVAAKGPAEAPAASQPPPHLSVPEQQVNQMVMGATPPPQPPPATPPDELKTAQDAAAGRGENAALVDILSRSADSIGGGHLADAHLGDGIRAAGKQGVQDVLTRRGEGRAEADQHLQEEAAGFQRDANARAGNADRRATEMDTPGTRQAQQYALVLKGLYPKEAGGIDTSRMSANDIKAALAELQQQKAGKAVGGAGAGGAGGDDLDSMAQMIANYQMDTPAVRDPAKLAGLMARVKKINPQFDGARFKAQQRTLGSQANNEKIIANKTVVHHMARLKQTWDAIPAGIDSPITNWADQKLDAATGGGKYSASEADAVVIGGEIAKSLGMTTQKEQEHVTHLVRPGQTRAQQAASLAELDSLRRARLGVSEGMLSNLQPGGSGANPASAPAEAPKKRKMTNPKTGAVVYVDD